MRFFVNRAPGWTKVGCTVRKADRWASTFDTSQRSSDDLSSRVVLLCCHRTTRFRRHRTRRRRCPAVGRSLAAEEAGRSALDVSRQSWAPTGQATPQAAESDRQWSMNQVEIGRTTDRQPAACLLSMTWLPLRRSKNHSRPQRTVLNGLRRGSWWHNLQDYG